jgi:hypothetical protein
MGIITDWNGTVSPSRNSTSTLSRPGRGSMERPYPARQARATLPATIAAQ